LTGGSIIDEKQPVFLVTLPAILLCYRSLLLL
jgi:hypothetical protein